MKQRIHSLLDASRKLEADIREGLFTPFLGAGASSLRSSETDLESYPWKEVGITITAISSTLSERSRDFLRSFTAGRLSLTSKHEIRRIIPDTNEPHLTLVEGTDLAETLLVKLQAELVRATVRLTHYFGVSFSRESPSIRQIEECSVDFDLESEEESGMLARDCLARLFAAAEITLELRKETARQRESPFLVRIAGVDRCFEGTRIYHKLLTLIVGLIGRHRDAYRIELAKHRLGGYLPIPYDMEHGKAASYGKLRLDAIQWLSDLLWYTVRYWVPYYPTTSELAFELSLAVKDAPPKPAKLAQAAQALENEYEGFENASLLAKIIGDLVMYCETVQERTGGPNSQTKAFYYGIAAALQYQFDRYRESIAFKGDLTTHQFSLKDRFRTKQNEEERPRTQLRAPVPIIFTTNFDSALERVFEMNGLCFHIVFPVLSGSSRADENMIAAPNWMIKTSYPRSQKINPPPVDWRIFCRLDENGVPRISFDGPIIVKLHGSPSLALPDAKTQHWLVLSEAGYLEAFESESMVPAWLGGQLAMREGEDNQGSWRKSVPRSLWFLGYSVSDWNVRLELYKHCREHRKLGGRRSTVDRSSDLYQTAILGALDVDQCLGDLNDLPCMILRTLEDSTGPRLNSEKLRQLTEGLRAHLTRFGQ